MVKISLPWLHNKAEQKGIEAGQHYLIFGLGNPGSGYRNNRHNVGFMLIDHLVKRLGVRLSRIQFKSIYGSGDYLGRKLTLVKPQTFMNLSGQAVGSFVRYYKIDLDHICVVYDDLDLPYGTLRLRAGGSSSGQKGVASTIQQLGTQDFPRLRIGIGRPPGRMQAADYVLQDFSAVEQKELESILDQAGDAVFSFIENGINKAMTDYNGVIDHA